MRRLRVAIIGSGPSGAYCAQELCEAEDVHVEVDVLERLPVPFGLVRYGVAPDHPKIKSIVTQFSEIFEDPRVEFQGNVRVGADVTIDELRTRYDAVIVSSGADVDRRLGISGEGLLGVHSATDFVSWYSGHPDSIGSSFDFDSETAVVIGAGNVALDVARMLCRTSDELRRTDVPEHVIEVLAESKIREVHVAARRGPAFAKYTNKELIELGALGHTSVRVRCEDLVLDDAQRVAADGDNLCKRRLGILDGFASDEIADPASRSIHLRFKLTPVEFCGDAGRLESVRFSTPSGSETVQAGTAFRSIGYRSAPIPGLPFDASSCIVPNVLGRITEGSGTVPGLYVVGWAKRGPSGVIGTNRKDAVETVGALLEDFKSGAIATKPPVRDRAAWADVVGGVVNWRGWKAIDREEVDSGVSVGRERVKVFDRDRMLAIASAQAAQTAQQCAPLNVPERC